jgi:hypothetical protein
MVAGITKIQSSLNFLMNQIKNSSILFDGVHSASRVQLRSYLIEK